MTQAAFNILDALSTRGWRCRSSGRARHNSRQRLGDNGTYRYLDMDVSIAEALAAADEFLRLAQNKQPIPTFFVKPV